MIFIKTVILEGQEIEITLGKAGESIDNSVEVIKERGPIYTFGESTKEFYPDDETNPFRKIH